MLSLEYFCTNNSFSCLHFELAFLRPLVISSLLKVLFGNFRVKFPGSGLMSVVSTKQEVGYRTGSSLEW